LNCRTGTAEGCFYINISNSGTKVGARVQLIFKITQHDRDIQLLNQLVIFFVGGIRADKAFFFFPEGVPGGRRIYCSKIF